jgi:hypothetical protein
MSGEPATGSQSIGGGPKERRIDRSAKEPKITKPYNHINIEAIIKHRLLGRNNA